MGYQNYNNNYQQRGNYNGQERPQRKKSGCKRTIGKSKVTGEDVPTVTGWNKSKQRGFITFVASAKKNGNGAGEVFTSKRGKEYVQYVAKMTLHKTMEERIVSSLYCITNSKLYFPDFNMVANPNAPNGGYFGTSQYKKR